MFEGKGSGETENFYVSTILVCGCFPSKNCAPFFG